MDQREGRARCVRLGLMCTGFLTHLKYFSPGSSDTSAATVARLVLPPYSRASCCASAYSTSFGA